MPYTTRYPGTRWTLLYANDAGVERFALHELQRGMQYLLPYVLTVQDASLPAPAGHLALLGTRQNNPLIAQLIEGGHVAAPTGAQGYTIASLPSPWDAQARLLVIAGTDAAGVLYGVEEFCARMLFVGSQLDGWPALRQQLDGMDDFSLSEAPAIAERGIWTWGYVIYDYRRFLDNMARLKLNLLTIWNDCVPQNFAEVIAYAHSRGIRVIAGFHWGWGNAYDLTSAEDRARIHRHVLATYHEQYAQLPIDGLYFQTLTEHNDQQLQGRSVAAWCVDLIRPIAEDLFAAQPHLHLQFGLHATSISECYADLRDLDSRVSIVWEDAGALPYTYLAELEGSGRDVETTLAYSRNLAAFRPDTPFAMVAKGWMSIRWDKDFEHHAAYILGERHPAFIQARLQARQSEWDQQNARWCSRFPLAAHFYREMLAVNPCLCVTGLIEDGLFETKIQPSVALFAETLWNPYSSDEVLLTRATRPYYGRTE